ncbi:MAG: class II aldolase/adducin family protein, partial [Oscillospiraceae bacterium]|nr:class II aldolase/adducin family protein [Oscillospiraceae bacterium]
MRKISDSEARRDMISAGNQLHAARLCASNDGNISVRTAENAVWATPTNVSKGGMTEDMLVLLDLDGNILSGSRKPSSEVKMHL